jgi:arabinose-5-phosphate isomerase
MFITVVMSQTLDPTSQAFLAAARATIALEARALNEMAQTLDGPLGTAFVAAVRLCMALRGRIVVTGMGKSGHVGRKIAATLASTGSPAQFVHPAEASHGDLGMITPADSVLALSRSGETRELEDIVFHCRRQHVPLIAMTLRPSSTLAKAADVALVLPDFGEVSLDAPAPTTSTTMCLAMGDALAVALLQARGFTASDFGALHPGGTLGALLKRVSDVMRTGDALPLVRPDTPTIEMLAIMTEKALGVVGVVENGQLVGIFTDGDLRRQFACGGIGDTAGAAMTTHPKTILPAAPLADAMAVMSEQKITSLFAVQDGAPLGIVHMHDLLTAGVR